MKQMSRTRLLLLCLLLLWPAAAQMPQAPGRGENPPIGDEDKEVRLPNGKSRNDELAKAAYLASLDDTKKLIATAQELRLELEKNDRYVVSLAAIKKTEDIEKLAKRIRSRLKQ